jgi:hypothetical protein
MTIPYRLIFKGWQGELCWLSRAKGMAMQVDMDTKQHDSAAIQRIGADVVRTHFDLSPEGVRQWRCRGVPKHYRRPLALLGKVLGHEMPGFPDLDLPNAG